MKGLGIMANDYAIWETFEERLGDGMIDNGRLIAFAYGVQRRPGWRKAAHAWLKDHPACCVCGVTTQVQVHHNFPWHLCVLLGRPDLELDNRNFETLCESPNYEHHLLIGHLGSWESYNPDFDVMLRIPGLLLPDLQGKTAEQIVALDSFQGAMRNRPKPWSAMTDDDKAKLRADMDRLMPKLEAA